MSQRAVPGALYCMLHSHKKSIALLMTRWVPALLVVACGDTIDVFPASDGDAKDTALTDHTDAAVATSADDAGVPVRVSCDFSHGGGPTSACTVRNRFCSEFAGATATEITYLGCDAQGASGNSAIEVENCEQALAGETGETCAAQLSCTSRSADACCVRQAACDLESGLRVASVCVPNCETISAISGSAISDCASADAAAVALDFDAPTLSSLTGFPCQGDFVCAAGGSVVVDGERREVGGSSYGHWIFCGAGKVQLITYGPWMLPPPSALQ